MAATLQMKDASERMDQALWGQRWQQLQLELQLWAQRRGSALSLGMRGEGR
jgi:hypothetical protein